MKILRHLSRLSFIARKITIVVSIAMNRSAIRVRPAQPSTRSRCLTRNLIQESCGPHYSRSTEKSRRYSSTALSASIAHYRYQAKYFNGQPDGKIEVVARETKGF